MKLWPRLPLPRAQALARDYSAMSLEELEDIVRNPRATRLFAPTGGTPVDDGTLRRVRQAVVKCAVSAGYPRAADHSSKAAWDDGITRYLADLSIPLGEAIRPETWAWLCTVLVPDVVRWRWVRSDDTVTVERFAGPLYRNALGRLWYAAVALDRGKEHPERWLFVDSLGADQQVSLLERPSLAANASVCAAVGESWLQWSERPQREKLFREAMKVLLVRGAICRLDVLSEQDLAQVVNDAFALTARRLGLT